MKSLDWSSPRSSVNRASGSDVITAVYQPVTSTNIAPSNPYVHELILLIVFEKSDPTDQVELRPSCQNVAPVDVCAGATF